MLLAVSRKLHGPTLMGVPTSSIGTVMDMCDTKRLCVSEAGCAVDYRCVELKWLKHVSACVRAHTRYSTVLLGSCAT